MRLGWRNPRPNDFTAPNQRPLRDLFGNLQKFMSWPYDRATISGNPGVGFTVMTLTPITANTGASPHNLIRNNTFQAPTEFDGYVAVGALYVAITGAAAAGTYTAIWRQNGVVKFAHNEEKSTAGGTIRISVPIVAACRAGDTFDIQTGSSGGATTLVGGADHNAFLFFLPFT